MGQGGVGTPELLAQAGKVVVHICISYTVCDTDPQAKKGGKLQKDGLREPALENQPRLTRFYAPFPHCLNRSKKEPLKKGEWSVGLGFRDSAVAPRRNHPRTVNPGTEVGPGVIADRYVVIAPSGVEGIRHAPPARTYQIAELTFARMAVIFDVAVRPKHPPLWRTKFVGLTAFRFWVPYRDVATSDQPSTLRRSPSARRLCRTFCAVTQSAWHSTRAHLVGSILKGLRSFSPGLDRRGAKGRRSYPG